MGRMSVVQIEDTMTDRMYAWFEMVVDTDWADVLANHIDEVQAYVLYFQQLNDTHLKDKDPVVWIQIRVILCEMDVFLDRQEPEDEAMFDTMVQCLDHLWRKLTAAML